MYNLIALSGKLCVIMYVSLMLYDIKGVCSILCSFLSDSSFVQNCLLSAIVSVSFQPLCVHIFHSVIS